MRYLYILNDGSHSVTKNIFSSGWKQDNIGWWYQNVDGSYPKSAWQLIDGKYYYFNEVGYMLSNTTTPDGYQVDFNGVWIQ
jgi:glucan-binding YG repeat protein